MSEQPSLFQTLKKRRIFRIGGMYLVGAWVLLQFGEILIGFMDLPQWTGRALIVLVSLGFPFILLLAWVFDVSTQSQASAPRAEDSTAPITSTKQIDIALGGLLLFGIALAAFLWSSSDDTSNIENAHQLNETPEEVVKIMGGTYILVGNLVDFTGSSGDSGQAYGQAIIDATNYINENGGINGKLIDLDTIETSYQVRRALDAYKKWSTQKIVAIQGWGTGIGQALQSKITEDHIPYFSASYAASFTDPMGTNVETAAPYNFFYGPSYSDGCRGLVQWAHSDWIKRNEEGQPSFVHMGDNQPYPNAPRDACERYAESLGFEVLPIIIFSMVPEDYSRQCQTLKQLDPDYVFLANLDKSVSELLKQCDAYDIDSQFMANIFGFDETVMQSAGLAADGVVWVMGASAWNDPVPGMYTVKEISKMSDPQGSKYRSVHYIRGVCSMFYLKEAMETAEASGNLAGQAIKQAMYDRTDWVPKSLEGVCLPATWTESDHRGVAQVLIYQASVNSATDNRAIDDLFDDQTFKMEPVFEASIERKPEWLGW